MSRILDALKKLDRGKPSHRDEVANIAVEILRFNPPHPAKRIRRYFPAIVPRVVVRIFAWVDLFASIIVTVWIWSQVGKGEAISIGGHLLTAPFGIAIGIAVLLQGIFSCGIFLLAAGENPRLIKKYSDKNRKKCSECEGKVEAEVQVCRFCGHRFTPSRPRLKMIRAPARLTVETIGDSSVTPLQVEQMPSQIPDGGKSSAVPAPGPKKRRQEKQPTRRPSGEYSEAHHTEGKPSEVIELYRTLDRICQDLAPGGITREYKARYVRWALGKAIFCCAHLQQGGLRVWVKTDPKALDLSVTYARDVSKIRHWGVGEVELTINSLERLRDAGRFIQESFNNATQK